MGSVMALVNRTIRPITGLVTASGPSGPNERHAALRSLSLSFGSPMDSEGGSAADDGANQRGQESQNRGDGVPLRQVVIEG